MRTPAGDASPAAWLAERLLEPWSTPNDGMPVGAIVPTGFEAYARMLPPVYEHPSGRRLRWRDLAAINGRIAHPLMEWHLIRTPAPGSGRPLWSPLSRVRDGPPEDDQLRELASVLRGFSGATERCWYCVWSGYAGIEETEGGAEVDHGDRVYFLSSGPIEAVTSFEQGPNIWWPDDRAWCVASEIDLPATYIGASARCIDALLDAEVLEVMPVQPEDRVDVHADVINETGPGDEDWVY
jgi:hypothetical protein